VGFRSGTECRADLLDVAQEMCAGLMGVSSAGVVRCVSVAGSAGGYVLDVETTQAGATTSAQIAVPQVPCDENERVTDLAQLWGMGLVAVLGVFLIREFIYRLVQPQ
jgi:hypothetical protein